MDHRNTQHSVSVAGVIVDDQGRALLVQRRDNGHWEAPGGVLERDEDVITGLLREIHEETGLAIVAKACIKDLVTRSRDAATHRFHHRLPGHDEAGGLLL